MFTSDLCGRPVMYLQSIGDQGRMPTGDLIVGEKQCFRHFDFLGRRIICIRGAHTVHTAYKQVTQTWGSLTYLANVG